MNHPVYSNFDKFETVKGIYFTYVLLLYSKMKDKKEEEKVEREGERKLHKKKSKRNHEGKTAALRREFVILKPAFDAPCIIMIAKNWLLVNSTFTHRILDVV